MVPHDIIRDELLYHLGDAPERQVLEFRRATNLDELRTTVATAWDGICCVQKNLSRRIAGRLISIIFVSFRSLLPLQLNFILFG